MLKNINQIITKEEIKKIKEIEENELLIYMNTLFKKNIHEALENEKQKEDLKTNFSEFRITEENGIIKTEFKGKTIDLMKMFIKAFLENKEFKTIVLNLCRLNFVYTKNEIKEIFKINKSDQNEYSKRKRKF